MQIMSFFQRLIPVRSGSMKASIAEHFGTAEPGCFYRPTALRVGLEVLRWCAI